MMLLKSFPILIRMVCVWMKSTKRVFVLGEYFTIVYLHDQYYIEAYDKINEFDNQGIYDALQKEPLYVQVGLNPRYFQFHEPGCEHPVHAGHRVGPTYAGVLTGIQLPLLGDSEFTGTTYEPDGYEYWEMYIRRHGNDYNYVRLNCTFQRWNKTTGELEWNQPFAGLASKMYRVMLPEKLPEGNIQVTPSPSTPGESTPSYFNENDLIDAVEAAIEKENDPDSIIDTSTVYIDDQYLDPNASYNLTSVQGISTVVTNGYQIIDTTGTLSYMNFNGRRLAESDNAGEVIKMNFKDLSVRGISFADDMFQTDRMEITVESIAK